MKIYDATVSVSDVTTYSDPIIMFKDSGFSVGISWTGTLTATITLQLGVKVPQEDGGGYVWGDTDETFPAVPAGTAGTSVESWDYQNADAVRLKVVHTGSSGVLKAYGKVK